MVYNVLRETKVAMMFYAEILNGSEGGLLKYSDKQGT
jgi:hypothetical protein